MNKRGKFDKILRDIKDIKIQGARNIAKAALEAYSLYPSAKTKQKLISLRPTEPMMQHVLDLVETRSIRDIKKHFDEAQDKINKRVLKLIKNGDVIFTHCHSTNVVNALIYAKKKGKKFEVYNTETRPLFQGRKTARDLAKARIKVTMFVDAAVGIALAKEQGTKRATKVFLGADAITKKGIVNKVGSEVIARIAKQEKIPVYVIADSWKFTNKKIKIEQRKLNEVWDQAPPGIKMKNPAFEFVRKKFITKVVMEREK
jgi:ribose 1,5-bisphosphate isomerase